MAPQRPTGAAVLTPIVEPSQVTDDEEALNSVVMAATRTFYTTSTFYTTLVEGGSTVVRSRTEVTSRMQTELSTTWLQVATTALSPLVSQTVTWLGQPGYQQDLEDEGEQEQQLVFLTPVRQTAASTVESAGGDSVQDSVQDLDEQSLTSAAATGVVTEEDKNAVLLAIQALVAEADKESTGSDQPASAPTVLIPDTVVSSPGCRAKSRNYHRPDQCPDQHLNEVSVEHSVSEAAAPPLSTADAGANEEDPVEVVVGVSTAGEVVADVTEVTTTEQPSSVTAGPETTFETQDGTKGTSVPREGEDSSSVPSTTSTAAPPTGRGSVAIAGLLIPTQKENDANRGVETPGLEQPLLSEDKEQEDKCPRQCQAAINEVCRKMGGEHRCLCRPGFSRARDSDACEPSLTYQVRMLLDRVNDIPLQYRRPFAEPASPEYRQLAELAAGGLRQSLSSSGPLASRLHGATLMEFKRAADLPGVAPSRPQALMADVMVQITDRESKSLDKDGLQVIVEESLRRSNYSLSDRQVVVSPLHGDVTVIDFDECQNPDYNDCHEGAFCFNLVGSFTCSCRDGLVDTGVPSLPGRSCTGEYSGCPECSYSGECYTEPSGEPACRCHRWYAGQRCQVNLRVLLIALASAGALLAALLCVCCYFCCRRRGRRMAAPPLVFSGPGGLWRHRGSRLHQPVADQRAMLDSSSDTSIPVSSRRRPPSGGKRLLPPLSGGSKPSGPGSRSSQQPSAGEAQRPARFLPRPRHKTDAPSGPRSINSQGGGDPAVAPNRTQPQLMGLLHPSEAARGRSAGGTFRAGRTSRSSGRAEPDSQVSHTPAGRSRSSSGGRRPEPEVSQLPSGRSRSRSSDSVSGEPERIECGTHNFFRARTMSDALSFNEELIEPSVRPVARFDTTRSQRSSHAPSSHGYTYEHHTMAERDAASTYVMPETHLFRRAQDSDAQSETSLVEDFPRMDGSSTVSSRRGFR
ncbi:Protocadherin Fat 4 [Amphibalanus amphitrite]|uniref:Protocadherin Fat 4 n=1 Tax=Amphibalanus amphitrite TaxID=1232801 RepID=A0A6A4XDV9_AMPAM|nr:Protocadherin Fat 4 [Amphibalanus amphitrite]